MLEYFVLRAKGKSRLENGEIIYKARNRMANYANKHQAPFVAALYRDSSVNEYKL